MARLEAILVVNSPLVWVGGKAAWADWLASLLPPHGMYVEVFGGGASVLLAKKPSKVEVYNDLDGDLANLFRVLRDQADDFKLLWRWTIVSREEFERLWALDPEALDPLQRAFRYLYLNRAGFSGHMRRPAFSVKASAPNNVGIWAEQAQQHIEALHQRMKRVYVERMDFRELIPYYDGLKSDGGTVFFIDQPYHVKDPAYVHWFTEQDHSDLANVVRNIKARWLMTINDDAANREWYKGFHIMEKPKQYSLAKEDVGRREFGELIISNYELPQQKQVTLF